MNQFYHLDLVKQWLIDMHLCALQGSMDDAEQPAAPTSMLSPAWRMMVLSNGSVTRHLEHLTGHKVHVVRL